MNNINRSWQINLNTSMNEQKIERELIRMSFIGIYIPKLDV